MEKKKLKKKKKEKSKLQQICEKKEMKRRNTCIMVTVGLHPRRIAPIKLKRFYDAYFRVGQGK